MRRIVLVLLLLMLMVLPVSATTEMYCNPAQINSQRGEPIQIAIIIKPDQQINAVSIDKMSWDSNILQFVNAKEGDFFNCSLVWIPGKAGKDNYTNLCWGCNTPTDKQGTLVIFTFKAITDGKSNVTIDHVGVAYAGEKINTTIGNCIVTVGSGIYVASSKTAQIPIYLIASLIIIVIAVIGFILLKRKSKFPRNPNYPNK